MDCGICEEMKSPWFSWAIHHGRESLRMTKGSKWMVTVKKEISREVVCTLWRPCISCGMSWDLTIKPPDRLTNFKLNLWCSHYCRIKLLRYILAGQLLVVFTRIRIRLISFLILKYYYLYSLFIFDITWWQIERKFYDCYRKCTVFFPSSLTVHRMRVICLASGASAI
jgi:hypothetical protein